PRAARRHGRRAPCRARRRRAAGPQRKRTRPDARRPDRRARRLRQRARNCFAGHRHRRVTRMWRVLLFLIKIAVLGAAAVWLYERPGIFTVEWLGHRLEMPVGIALLALLVLLALAALIYRLWRALVTAPRRITHARASTRRRQGYRALTQGMVAVAAGDA